MKQFISLQRLKTLMKSHFLAGLFVLIPLGVIAWILFSALGMLWSIPDWLPENWRPEHMLPNAAAVFIFNLVFMAAVILILSIAVSALGWASKHYFGKQILEFIKHLIERIPVIRSIYSALDQLLKTLASQGGQQFSRVVYVEYPRKGLWVIAFVTGPAQLPPKIPREAAESEQETYLNIYVPTTPNPTSGFHLVVRESEVHASGLTVEQAFKVILSLGLTQPNPQPNSFQRNRK